MNQSLQELASRYVLDQLESEERAAFEARLAHDPAALALVREFEAVLAARVRLLPRHEPPDDLLVRIEATIDRERTPASSAPDRGLALRWALIGGLAALALMAVGLAVYRTFHPAPAAAQPMVVVAVLDTGRGRQAEMPLQDIAPSPDARFIQLAALAEKYWRDPGALPVKEVKPHERGFAIFDPGTDQGFLAIRDVPTPAPGRRYHLWIVETRSGQVREAGALPLGPDDHGLFFFSVPGAAGAQPTQLGFLITAEDTATPPTKPSGHVVLGSRGI